MLTNVHCFSASLSISPPLSFISRGAHVVDYRSPFSFLFFTTTEFLWAFLTLTRTIRSFLHRGRQPEEEDELPQPVLPKAKHPLLGSPQRSSFLDWARHHRHRRRLLLLHRPQRVRFRSPHPRRRPLLRLPRSRPSQRQPPRSQQSLPSHWMTCLETSRWVSRQRQQRRHRHRPPRPQEEGR